MSRERVVSALLLFAAALVAVLLFIAGALWRYRMMR